jgi:flavorubredoxin
MNRKQIETIEKQNMLIDEAIEPQFVVVKHFDTDFNGNLVEVARTIESASFITNQYCNSIIFTGSYIDCTDFCSTSIDYPIPD